MTKDLHQQLRHLGPEKRNPAIPEKPQGVNRHDLENYMDIVVMKTIFNYY